MALSLELDQFCRSWQTKASACGDDLHGCFDKFFTLYVVFNRLYAEATFRLARHGCVNLRDRFPDAQGAQDYLLQYCGATRLTTAWQSDPIKANALTEIAAHLREGRFALKLDMITGAPRPDADRELLAAMESRGRNRRAKAYLEALYAIRCNMFHGHKGFAPIQIKLLRPALVLLEGTIGVLRQTLIEDSG